MGAVGGGKGEAVGVVREDEAGRIDIGPGGSRKIGGGFNEKTGGVHGPGQNGVRAGLVETEAIAVELPGQGVGFSGADDVRSARFPDLEIVAALIEIGEVNVFHVVDQTGAASHEIAVGAIIEEKVQVIDGFNGDIRGGVEMPVPDQGGGGDEFGAGDVVGDVEIVVIDGIARGKFAAGVGVEIPAAQDGFRAGGGKGWMGVAG